VDAIGHAARLVLGIAQIEAVDDLRTRIAQQRVVNVTLRDESGILGGIFVGDPCQIVSAILELFQATVKVHELGLAIRAPGRRPEEKQDQALRAHQRLQRPRRRFVVQRRADVRHRYTHLRTEIEVGLAATGPRPASNMSAATTILTILSPPIVAPFERLQPGAMTTKPLPEKPSQTVSRPRCRQSG
jgi:hypothetical protein